MARKRMLSPTIWESAYDKQWSADDLAVMIAAISSADDEGRGRVSVIFRSLGPMITSPRFKKSLEKLAGSVEIYQEIYYYLPNWLEYQSISKPQPSKIPSPKSRDTKELPEKSNGIIPVPVKEESWNDSNPSEVSRSEDSLKEINVSEVKGTTHINFNELFTLFYLTFNEDPTPQERNQIIKTVKEYLEFVKFEEQVKIYKILCSGIREGPYKKKTKGYFFATFKLRLQDACANKSITDAKALARAMKF